MSVSVAFIDANRHRWPVAVMCRVLDLAERSYYAAKTRDPSARAGTDALWRVEIRRVWEANYQVYGARRVWPQLRREGHQDHSGVNVDHERHVHPPGVSLDVGDVGHPQAVRGRRSELALDEIRWPVEAVVRVGGDRPGPAPPVPHEAHLPHQASTVQRATLTPSSLSWAQIFAAPYTNMLAS